MPQGSKPPKQISFEADKAARERPHGELFAETLAAQDKDSPAWVKADGEDADAWFRRTFAIANIIEQRGGFDSHTSFLALHDGNWETKEAVAGWLRNELRSLRLAEATPGASPVRRTGALPKSEIADIAVELVQGVAGDALSSLIQELLDVDRHRKALADPKAEARRIAADIQAQIELTGAGLSGRGLAKLVSVAPSTVSNWKQENDFLELVASRKRFWRMMLAGHLHQARSVLPQASEAECFRRAFELLTASPGTPTARHLRRTRKQSHKSGF